MSWVSKRVDSVSFRSWQAVIVAVGMGLSFVHLSHLPEEEHAIALLVGVLIPLGISLAVIAIGVGARYSTSLRPLVPRMTTWLLLAMFWMAIAGAGAVIYEHSEGSSLSHSMYLIATFATYGCLPGLLTGWYDGQRRKHLNNVSQREDQLAVLSRILRHNLRNDMNVILGHSNTLLEDEDPAVRAHASKIHDVGRKLLDLTEKERIFVDTVMESPDLLRLDLGTLLSQIIREIQDKHPGAEITVSGDSEQTVRAVPRFERALREIIENAIEHNDSAVPEVRIRAERNGELLHLEITDNGPGISAGEANVLVGEQPISPLNHGSGLGVRLANVIIEQSGGEMDLISTEEDGTKVPITLQAV